MIECPPDTVSAGVQGKLRAGLKAELGAFYPLLLLRPLENDRRDLHTASAPRGCLQGQGWQVWSEAGRKASTACCVPSRVRIC